MLIECFPRIATFISSLAHCVNRENNAVAKLKSILLQKEGLTNEGLDSFSMTGLTESSRSQRNVKDFFAGIASEVLKSSAKLYPHVRAMDNLDINIGGMNHHFTQEFIEIEQRSTKELEKKSKSFEEMCEMFKTEKILLTSAENKPLLKHFKMVVAITIGRLLADRLPEARFLKSLLENHYHHPHRNLNPSPALLFIQKPLYLHEIVNDEMIQIEEEIQLDFLKLIAEQASNREAFLRDLELIQKKDCDNLEREAAEQRVHQEVLEVGEYIGHGDYLTWQKFYDAKRMLESSITALERKEYIKYFKLALFHMKMNKGANNFNPLYSSQCQIITVSFQV